MTGKTVQQLLFRLRWQAAVDLDLMAFYRTVNGDTGSVYSSHYAGGDLGELTQFPFIALNRDAGTDAVQGRHEEVLRITRMDDMTEIVVCALNFSNAIDSQQQTPFSQYNGYIDIVDDNGNTEQVPLNTVSAGEAVLIARVISTEQGAQLQMENRLISLTDLHDLPGAEQLQVDSKKVVLTQTDDSYQLCWQRQQDDICLNLKWQAPSNNSGGGLMERLLMNTDHTADLDLGCFYELNTGETGLVQALGECFGQYDTPPYVLHLGDDRVGRAEGETIRINGQHLAQFRRVLVYAYIYQGVANWAQANPVVTIRQADTTELVLQLTEDRPVCRFCAVAQISLQPCGLKVTREMRFFSTLHELDDAYQWGLNWLSGQKH